ncbi:MAG: GNAT family N-acetyltransferase [Acidobacteriota bacterium]
MPDTDLDHDPGGTEHAFETPALETRHPRVEDLDAICAIDRQWTHHERRAFLGERLRRALRPRGISLARVCESAGEVCGFLLGEVTHGEFGRVAPVAWIDTIGVARDRLHHGVGTLLLQDFLRHARLLGVESVRTMLEPTDTALGRFLEAQEFQDARTRVVERRFDAQGGSS